MSCRVMASTLIRGCISTYFTVICARISICVIWEETVSTVYDVASDVGVNLCNVKSCFNTSNNEIFTDKRGDLPSVNISKHTCPVVK